MPHWFVGKLRPPDNQVESILIAVHEPSRFRLAIRAELLSSNNRTRQTPLRKPGKLCISVGSSRCGNYFF
jgi:hypothetical protein